MTIGLELEYLHAISIAIEILLLVHWSFRTESAGGLTLSLDFRTAAQSSSCGALRSRFGPFYGT